LAGQVAEKLNREPSCVKVLIPRRGWSEADREGEPLYDLAMSGQFLQKLKADLNPEIDVVEVDFHINDPAFARIASETMHAMLG
jgi:uncharacterized protein (UPF0261 family)